MNNFSASSMLDALRLCLRELGPLRQVVIHNSTFTSRTKWLNRIWLIPSGWKRISRKNSRAGERMLAMLACQNYERTDGRHEDPQS